jgi:hypothetical protein
MLFSKRFHPRARCSTEGSCRAAIMQQRRRIILAAVISESRARGGGVRQHMRHAAVCGVRQRLRQASWRNDTSPFLSLSPSHHGSRVQEIRFTSKRAQVSAQAHSNCSYRAARTRKSICDGRVQEAAEWCSTAVNHGCAAAPCFGRAA